MRKLLIAVCLFAAVPAFAQNTDIEALSGLQFNFGNPGARALGMGGAFLGLADDASAAEANPAGLTILRKPEVSIEVRNSETTQNFYTTGVFPDLVRTGFDARSRTAEVSFGSFVLSAGSNAAVAVYYAQPIAIENNINNIFSDPILYYFNSGGQLISQEQCFSNPSQCTEYKVLPFYTQVNLRMKTYGLAGAYKIGSLSLGAAARYQQLDEEAFTFRTDFSGNPLSVIAQVSDEDDITFSGGFKWAPSDRFSVGGVYKQGPEFEAPIIFASAETGGDFIEIGAPNFHAPDTMGVGISFRPVPALTINADAVNVTYSNLVDDFLSFTRDVENTDFEAEDVTEYHVGAEYFFTTKIPVAIRGGWWRDPAHQPKFTGPIRSPFVVAEAILFPGNEDEDHLTGGIGFSWPRFSVDLAYDTSDNYKVGSISVVTRF